MRSHFFFTRKILIFPLIFLTGALLFAQTPQDDYDELEALLNSIIQNQEKEEEPIDITEVEEQKDVLVESGETTTPEDFFEQKEGTEEALVESEEAPVPEEFFEQEKEATPQEEFFEQEKETAETDLPPSSENKSETEPATESEPKPEAPIKAEPEPANEPETHKYEALAMIRYKNNDTVSFRLKGSLAPGPYILGLAFSAGYTAYKLIQPFYFGGFIEPHIGFPQKNFPYKYQMDGSSISSPLIVGGKLYVPFGICVYPFQRNIEFFVDIAPGITMNMLWNRQFGKKSISSRLFAGFYGVIRTGASYKNFSVFLEGTYDAVTGFGVSLGFGYNLSINYTTHLEEEAPKSLED